MFTKRHFEHFAKALKTRSTQCENETQRAQHNQMVTEIADIFNDDANQMDYRRFLVASGYFDAKQS